MEHLIKRLTPRERKILVKHGAIVAKINRITYLPQFVKADGTVVAEQKWDYGRRKLEFLVPVSNVDT